MALNRPKPVFVRLSEEEKEDVKNQALKLGISLSTWARCIDV